MHFPCDLFERLGFYLWDERERNYPDMTVTDILSLGGSGDLELSKLLIDKVQAPYQLLSLSDFSWLQCISSSYAQPGGD